jgi:hypothetical protein
MTYDGSLGVLRRALHAAKPGRSDKLDGLRRPDRVVQVVERRYSPVADFDKAVAHNHLISRSLEFRVTMSLNRSR